MFANTVFLFFKILKLTKHYPFAKTLRYIQIVQDLAKFFHVKKFQAFGSRTNFRLLMQSSRFFFSRPFIENFEFLMN